MRDGPKIAVEADFAVGESPDEVLFEEAIQRILLQHRDQSINRIRRLTGHLAAAGDDDGPDHGCRSRGQVRSAMVMSVVMVDPFFGEE